MQDRTIDLPDNLIKNTGFIIQLSKWTAVCNWVVFGLVILLGGFRLQQISVHFFENQSQPTKHYQYDFNAYYVAAATLNFDTSLSLYNREVLEETAKISGMRTSFSEYIYPPFFAVILRPLALLPQITAINIWTILNLLWLGIGLKFLLKIIGVNLSWYKSGLLYLFLLIFPPVYHTILIFGQVNLFLLFLFIITLYGTHQKDSRSWQILSGIALGIGVGIKLFFAVLIVYYFFYNRRRVAITAVLTVLITIVIGALGAVPSNTTDYFFNILLDVSKINKTMWVNLSLEPSIKRFFIPGEFQYKLTSTSEPVTAIFRPSIHSAALGKSISLIAKYSLAGITALLYLWDWLSPRHRVYGIHDYFRASLLLISVLLFLPLSWFSTFVLIVVPLFVLWPYFKTKSIPINFFYSYILLVYLLFLANDSFFYLDHIFHRPINTIILSLGLLAILSIWLIIVVILSRLHIPKIGIAQTLAYAQKLKQKYLVIGNLIQKNKPLFVILGLGLLLRVIAMQGKGLWYDELQSVTHASLPIQDMLSSLQTYDPHPPLYYLQLHYWLKLGTSDFWIKSNSILTSIIAIISLYFLARKYFNQRTALITGLLFAIAPYAVNYGSEARNYALWMLLVIWIYELNNRVLLGQHKLLSAAGLFLVTIAFLYLHGISFLVLPAIYVHALILLFQRKISFNQLGVWGSVQILVIVAYVPWLQRAWTIGNVTPAVVPGFEDIITTLYIHLLGYCNYLSIWFTDNGLLTWLAICIFTAVRWPVSRITILAYTFTPALTAIVISYLIRPIWLFRGLGLIVPFMILAIAIWLDKLLDETTWGKVTSWGMTALTISIFSLALFNQHRTLDYPWDFKQATLFVKMNAQPGETVYLAHERLFWCWNWYFLGPGQTNPIQSDYSTKTSDGIKVISKPAWREPLPDKGYWQVYRDFDIPLTDTSAIAKQIWNFDDLIVEYIPPQSLR